MALLSDASQQSLSPEHSAWNVPYHRNVHFTGRGEELTDLRKSLAGHDAKRRVQVICGLGGVGKTQTALEYAYRHRGDYKIVWWINADEPATLALGYARLATQIGMHVPEGTSLDDIRHALRRRLDERDDWLLIFDNVAGVEDIRNYLPTNRTGHVLITSRNPNWESIARPLPLKPMKRVDSVQFLMHRTGKTKSDTSVGMLAQALGDLPLAMEQAAACIERTRIDFGGYLKRFETHWAELLNDVKGATDYPDSVEMTWEISFRQLQNEAPHAANLLNLLSFLGPDAIPHELLRTGAATLPESLANLAGDELSLREAIAALRTYSLIEDDGSVMGVHRLVGTLVRDRLSEDERRMWAETAIRMVVCAFKFDTYDLASWDACAQMLPHALAAAWHAEANDAAPRATITVLDDAGRYLIKRAQYAEAKGLFERAMSLASRLYGDTHPQVSSIANNLGRAHRYLGNVEEARQCLEKLMAIDQQVYGESDPRMAAVFNNYGILLQQSGDAEGARQQFEWALSVYQTHYGQDHPKVASIVNNLGYVLKGSGDLAGGRENFQRALEIARSNYGDTHPNVASILINLGVVQRLLGDLDGARISLERALEICEQVSGPSHPTVARACGHLGATFQDLKMFGPARMYFEQALNVDEGFYGSAHPNIAGRAVQLGRVLRMLEDKEGAQALFDRATAILASSSELKSAG
ncbi:MAG: FxSxx-COOH system tetratricopeptide repeat protein [Tepidisphaeraceae bacterium]